MPGHPLVPAASPDLLRSRPPGHPAHKVCVGGVLVPLHQGGAIADVVHGEDAEGAGVADQGEELGPGMEENVEIKRFPTKLM